MDSHKFNMYAGAVIGSVLFFLLLGFFSDLLYVGRGHSEHEQLAFAVDIEADEVDEATSDEPDWATLVAAVDMAKGEKLFKKCAACHKIEDGADGVGPNLWGVVGRDIGSVEGFGYSDALASIEGDWDLESLSAFLESPKGFAPGTSMTFAGLKKIEDRVNLIAYLNEADGTPIELASAAGTVDAAVETVEAATAEAAEAVAETAAEATTEAMEAVTEAAESTAEATTEATETAAETTAEAAETAAETAAEATTEAAETTVAAVTESATEATEAATETVESETESAAETVTAALGGGDYAEQLAAADVKAGKKLFRKCRACHSVKEGKNGVGPSLFGIIGRDVASLEDFKYSDAMQGVEGNWTLDKIVTFIENPMSVVVGTKMRFKGYPDLQDRINVITFLNEADGTPEPLQ